MLRISKLADYGTVVMVYLARQEKVLSNARDIAKSTHLTLPTVSKILKILTKANVLVSERGVRGGYRLAYPASQISVADIVFALEQQRGFTACSLAAGECGLQPVCPVQGNWRIISQAIEGALASLSLEALAQPNMQAPTLVLNVAGVRCGEK